mgnify:CR=1 FL=1
MAVRKKKTGGEIILIDALKDLCAEKEINPDSLFDAIESALIFACKKSASADKKIMVDLDRNSGVFHIYELRDIVEVVTNPVKEISLADAQKININYEVGGVVRNEIPPNNFGRIAAQAAKQFVMQKIREAERGVVYDEFTNKDNDIVTGTVTRIEDGNVIVDIGKTEAVLVPVEQIYTDRFQVGDRVRAYVAEVRKIGKGPQVYLSRTHPGFLRRLFESEVPEIQEGIISIKTVAREAGNRSKIAVVSSNPDVDPVGACLGEHGVRAQAIAKELGEEKIDVVKWDEDPAIFIANALSPSKVMKVAVNEYDKVSHVVVPNNQLSLAIGKEGQNARLAAKITGWKIDIKSKAQAKDDVYDDDLRIVQIAPERPKKQKPQKQKFQKPAPMLDENGNPIKKKKNKNKNKNKNQNKPQIQNVEATFTNPFDDNPFGDNPFEDNPFGDSSFDGEAAAAPVENKPAPKSAENQFSNPFDSNPFGDNSFDSFGGDSFESIETPKVEPVKVETAPAATEPVKAEVAPENKVAESKPAAPVNKPEKKFKPKNKPAPKPAPTTFDNPFGDNPFDDNPFGDNPF